ncbi:MAG: hypothetical protein LH609_12285 [Rudanella sp.]|nr:hypothetical protein [Rudanella sp.]
MKKLFVLGSLLILPLGQACTDKPRSEKTTSDTAASVETKDAPNAETALTERLTILGLTTDSDWRGIQLGDPVATVRAAEKGTLFESDAKHLGYTIEFPNLESADVLYQLDAKQTVSSIDVDLYLNNEKSATAYQTELTNYFNARYKPAGTPATWTGENKETVTLKNVSKGKDYGLKVRIVE